MRYVYYWYHHWLTLTIQNNINDIIINHDYDSFKQIQSILENKKADKEKYFPGIIHDTENDCTIPLDFYNFHLIGYAECENG